jgi:hypothetical protein
MKMIRNMALSFDGKFYATQGGPLRPGYSVSEAQLPTDWETRIITNYPQRITKDTMQFTIMDSDACGIEGLLSDFDPDASDAMCAKKLAIYVVVGDETSGAECDKDGSNMGTLYVREANAYVTNVAPSSVTVDGERVETLTVTFRTTTPFSLVEKPAKLNIKVYAAAFADITSATTAAHTLTLLYGDEMPAVTEAKVAAGVSAGKTFLGLADCSGKLYYSAALDEGVTTYTAAEPKFDRLVPIKLYYKFSD